MSTHTLFLIEELSVSNVIIEKVDETGHTGGSAGQCLHIPCF